MVNNNCHTVVKTNEGFSMDLQQRIMKGFDDFAEKYNTEPTILLVNKIYYAELQKTADKQRLMAASIFDKPQSLLGCKVVISDLAAKPILSKVYSTKVLYGDEINRTKDIYHIID